MLSYEQFKVKVKKEITKRLASEFPDFKGWDLVDSVRYSINRKIEFMELRPPEGKYSDKCMLPSFRYMPMYTGYMSGFSVSSIAQDVVDSMVSSMVSQPFAGTDAPVADQIMNPDHIYIALINKAMNQELLKTVPHVDFLDLAVIFRAILPMEGDGEYSTVINNGIFEDLGMTIEELLELASANSMRDFPPIAEKRNESYCLTSSQGSICSHALVSDQLLYDTAGRAGCNLYIVPITLRFSVAFPEEDFTRGELEDTSRRMSARLREEDRLSDRLYYYDRHAHRLSLCAGEQVCEENLQGLYSADCA